jgi:hypothetical protein
MMIPVYVQRPNEPPGLEVGMADDKLDAASVAQLVKVPEGCFLDGKVIRRRKVKPGQLPTRWSIVADVRFGVKG